VLGLREADELEDDAEKRDYGTWLHAVLWRFHGERPAPRGRDDDLARLRTIAREQMAADGFDAASFLPFEASFERFATHYADWLQERDAEGAQWLDGEAERRAAPPQLQGIGLHGRLDRIDRLRGGALQLIDYKTGSVSGLKDKLRNPLEDTQLAFYAALELARDEPPATDSLQAMYLALDDSGGIKELPHPNVGRTAGVLVQALAGELGRLREGASMPALGEGPVCEFCEARGLCRRDHWPDPVGDDADADSPAQRAGDAE